MQNNGYRWQGRKGKVGTCLFLKTSSQRAHFERAFCGPGVFLLEDLSLEIGSFCKAQNKRYHEQTLLYHQHDNTLINVEALAVVVELKSHDTRHTHL